MEDKKTHSGTDPAEEASQKAQSAAASNGAGNAAPHADPKAAPDLSKEAWDKAEEETPKTWDSSVGGRLAIRTFSRGVLGAMFFAASGLWASKLLHGTPGRPQTRYNAAKSFSEQENFLQVIAKSIDTFVGKPITVGVNLLGGDGVKAVHFKPTKFRSEYPGGQVVHGRSLGEEATFVTFDFFCMSIGDAIGRDILGWVDPVHRKIWAKDLLDQKGHIKWPEVVTSLCKRAWRYVSYNGGEDWAAAIPYVYFMKWHRGMLDKVSPGYGLDHDAGQHGANYRIAPIAGAGRSVIPGAGHSPLAGANQYEVVSHYGVEGVIDLQNRFTFYNMLTLLFREWYDKMAHAWKGEHVNLYGAPDAPVDPKKTILEKAGDVVKWGMRGVIKGFITMTPAVPFFWITRTTQQRHRSMFVDPTQNAALSFTDAHGEGRYVRGANTHSPVYFASYDETLGGGRGGFRQGPRMAAAFGNPGARPGFDAFSSQHTPNLIDRMFNGIGRMNSQFAHSFDGMANGMERSRFWQPSKWILGLQPSQHFSEFLRPTARAAVAYTPYMFMKRETALLWDNAATDVAAEGLIDAGTKLVADLVSGKGVEELKKDWKNIKRGGEELTNAVLHQPFADQQREQEAKRRKEIDTSAPDSADVEEWEQHHAHTPAPATAAPGDPTTAKPFAQRDNIKPQAASDLTWKERAMAGKANEQSVVTRHSPASYTEQAEQEKFLKEAAPLNTQAI